MRVWMPLPDSDFDTTEVAVPWKVLRERGHEVVFATERGGRVPACDPKLIDGVIFGKLGATPKAIAAYRELERSPEFNAPVPWSEIEPERFDGLVLARAGVLAKSRTTCLTKSMERGAYLLTSWRLGRYYRTYPAYVQEEVVAALDDPKQFDAGPMATYSRPWIVEDGRYVSGRWPGDASLFATRFEALLSAGPRPQPAAATPRQAT